MLFILFLGGVEEGNEILFFFFFLLGNLTLCSFVIILVL